MRSRFARTTVKRWCSLLRIELRLRFFSSSMMNCFSSSSLKLVMFSFKFLQFSINFILQFVDKFNGAFVSALHGIVLAPF
jgi:hypothetical protein